MADEEQTARNPSDPLQMAGVLEAAKKKGRGGPETWDPPFCGDLDMRIARDGTWFYLGTPIGRMPLVKLFSSVLRLEADGRFYLVTPVEKIGITVDDAPFLAITVDRDGDDLVFKTLTDDVVTAGVDHPIRVATDPETQEPAPYVMVRRGMEALINRNVFYQLVDMADTVMLDGREQLVVSSGGVQFSLGALDGSPAT